MRMPAGRPGCGYTQVALLHSKAPTLPPDVLRHQPPEKNNLVRNDLLEGTSRRSRDEILEAAGHHAHVTRRTQGPFWLCSVASRSLLHRVGGQAVEVLDGGERVAAASSRRWGSARWVV